VSPMQIGVIVVGHTAPAAEKIQQAVPGATDG
jgi:hypothetical protein